MKCKKCGATPISGKIIIQSDNGTEELNLCDKCLHEFIKEHPEVVNSADLGQMFKFFMTALGNFKVPEQINQLVQNRESAEAAKVACPNCKMSLKDLRNHKRTGCGTCYSFYREEIDAFLLNLCGENSQTKLQFSDNVENRLEMLHGELEKAIRLEKYELAARLRDDLKKLQKP